MKTGLKVLLEHYLEITCCMKSLLLGFELIYIYKQSERFLNLCLLEAIDLRIVQYQEIRISKISRDSIGLG